MKRRTSLLGFMIVLTVLFAAAPALAAPTNGQKVEAFCASSSILYASTNPLLDTLTKRCLDAGLSVNPYPAPPIPIRYYNPGHESTPSLKGIETIQIKDASAYYIITELRIGEDTFTGVSCNMYAAEMNVHTHDMNIQYDATWYIGALGDLSNGFAGNIEARLFNYWSGTPSTYDRMTLHLVMQGFGSFEGKILMLSFDSNMDTGGWIGYCLKG